MFLKRALFAFINMPIRNCPIYSFPDNKDTLILPIKVINLHNFKFLKTWGLVDTGAFGCSTTWS
jgi:hypothetical protein